ncbi:hypothetical protein amrb99_24040 [Actinomadura sp. RB99]|nr:hypothetical protein [Actinomadura sp. RB99]
MRERLAHCGFSDEVVHPPLPENFQHILDAAMCHHGTAPLERLLDDGSYLVTAGILDEAEVRGACRAFTATGDRVYEVYRR